MNPEADENARITGHFDALVAWKADPDTLLRAAVALAGCPAGADTRDFRVRLDSRGHPHWTDHAGRSEEWLRRDIPGFGFVWLERDQTDRVGNLLLLERLADALGPALARRARAMHDRPALEILLDPHAPHEERQLAARRLRIDASPAVRVLASPHRLPVPATREAVVPTQAGVLHASLDHGGDSPGPLGIGVAAPPLRLFESWQSATIALRLTSAARPVIRADDLGLLVPILQLTDKGSVSHADLTRLTNLVDRDRDALRSLDAILVTDSVRAAAGILGVHHSTLQRRVVEYTGALEFDPTSLEGRVRLAMSLHVYRLATARFD